MRESAKRSLRMVVEDGEPSAVILDIREYRRLLERLEDAEDLKLLERSRRKPLNFRKLDEFLAEYSRNDGLRPLGRGRFFDQNHPRALTGSRDLQQGPAFEVRIGGSL